jgi:hypothetical protein
MGNFNRDFIRSLEKSGFKPEVVDKAKHKQVFVAGQLVATLNRSGTTPNHRHLTNCRVAIARLIRAQTPKGNTDAQ